jgi:hypothetical protein
MRKLGYKPVHINVHPAFFEMLEKERKDMERKTGLPINQRAITEMIARGGTIKLKRLKGRII